MLLSVFHINLKSTITDIKSRIDAYSPNALGIEAASFASMTGIGNGKWDLGIWKRFLSEVK